jgi:hypothetical protein
MAPCLMHQVPVPVESRPLKEGTGFVIKIQSLIFITRNDQSYLAFNTLNPRNYSSTLKKYK